MTPRIPTATASRGWPKRLRQSISLSICLCLLVTSVPPSIFSTPISRGADVFHPPASLGSLTESFTSKGQRRVVLIQDLHINFEAQRNIARLLALYAERKVLPLRIGVEGAEGTIDTSILAGYPDPVVREATATYLLKKAELTGPGAYAVESGQSKLLYGIEADTYYQTHRALFQTNHDVVVQLRSALARLKDPLTTLRRRQYNRSMRTLKRHEDRYHEGDLPLTSYIRVLLTEAKRRGESLESGGYVTLGMVARAGLPQGPGFPLGFLVALNSDLARLNLQLRRSAAETTLQRNLVDVESRVALLQRLLRQEVTEEEVRGIADDWKQFAQVLDVLLKEDATAAGQKISPALIAQAVRGAIDFYAVAIARERPMFENTLRLLESGPNVSRRLPNGEHVTMIVLGGFHTAGLTTYLRQKGISYTIVTPRVTDIRPEDGSVYEDRLMDRHLTEREILGELDSAASRTMLEAIGYWIFRHTEGRRLARLTLDRELARTQEPGLLARLWLAVGSQWNISSSSGLGDRLGAKHDRRPRRPAPVDLAKADPAALLAPAERRLQAIYPRLYAMYELIRHRRFAAIMPGAVGLYSLHNEAALFIEERYQTLPPGISDLGKELLMFLHLVHESVEVALAQATAEAGTTLSLSPEFNRELAAFIAQAIAYQALSPEERAELRHAATALDSEETDERQHRYLPVLAQYETFDVGQLLQESTWAALAPFLSSYPLFEDQSAFDPRLHSGFMVLVRRLMDLPEPVIEETPAVPDDLRGSAEALRQEVIQAVVTGNPHWIEPLIAEMAESTGGEAPFERVASAMLAVGDLLLWEGATLGVVETLSEHVVEIRALNHPQGRSIAIPVSSAADLFYRVATAEELHLARQYVPDRGGLPAVPTPITLGRALLPKTRVELLRDLRRQFGPIREIDHGFEVTMARQDGAVDVLEVVYQADGRTLHRIRAIRRYPAEAQRVPDVQHVYSADVWNRARAADSSLPLSPVLDFGFIRPGQLVIILDGRSLRRLQEMVPTLSFTWNGLNWMFIGEADAVRHWKEFSNAFGFSDPMPVPTPSAGPVNLQDWPENDPNDLSGSGDRLGAKRVTGRPRVPAPSGSISEEFLSPAVQRLQQRYPRLYDVFQTITLHYFSRVMPGAAGLYRFQEKVALLLEDRYRNPPEGVSALGHELLIFLHLIHETVELALAQTAADAGEAFSVAPNFAREVAAALAQMIVYRGLTKDERDAVEEAARVLDAQDPTDRRYGRVLEFYQEFPMDALWQDATVEALGVFVAGYPLFQPLAEDSPPLARLVPQVLQLLGIETDETPTATAVDTGGPAAPGSLGGQASNVRQFYDLLGAPWEERTEDGVLEKHVTRGAGRVRVRLNGDHDMKVMFETDMKGALETGEESYFVVDRHLYISDRTSGWTFELTDQSGTLREQLPECPLVALEWEDDQTLNVVLAEELRTALRQTGDPREMSLGESVYYTLLVRPSLDDEPRGMVEAIRNLRGRGPVHPFSVEFEDIDTQGRNRLCRVTIGTYLTGWTITQFQGYSINDHPPETIATWEGTPVEDPVIGIIVTEKTIFFVYDHRREAAVPSGRSSRVQFISELDAARRWPRGIGLGTAGPQSVAEMRRSALLQEVFSFIERKQLPKRPQTGERIFYTSTIRTVAAQEFERQYTQNPEALQSHVSVTARPRGSEDSGHVNIEIAVHEDFNDPVALIIAVRDCILAEGQVIPELDEKLADLRRRLPRRGTDVRGLIRALPHPWSVRTIQEDIVGELETGAAVPARIQTTNEVGWSIVLPISKDGRPGGRFQFQWVPLGLGAEISGPVAQCRVGDGSHNPLVDLHWNDSSKLLTIVVEDDVHQYLAEYPHSEEMRRLLKGDFYNGRWRIISRSQWEREQGQGTGDRLGARRVRPRVPAPGALIPEEFLAPAVQRLKDRYPRLHEIFQRITLHYFSQVMPGAAGLYQFQEKVALLLEDRYRNPPEGVSSLGHELLIFLHLIHETVELALAHAAAEAGEAFSVAPNFAREVTAALAQMIVYRGLTGDERAAVDEAAKALDAEEKGKNDPRYGPVLEVYRQFPISALWHDATWEALGAFVAGYPLFRDFAGTSPDVRRLIPEMVGFLGGFRERYAQIAPELWADFQALTGPEWTETRPAHPVINRSIQDVEPVDRNSVVRLGPEGTMERVPLTEPDLSLPSEIVVEKVHVQLSEDGAWLAYVADGLLLQWFSDRLFAVVGEEEQQIRTANPLRRFYFDKETGTLVLGLAPSAVDDLRRAGFDQWEGRSESSGYGWRIETSERAVSASASQPAARSPWNEDQEPDNDLTGWRWRQTHDRSQRDAKGNFKLIDRTETLIDPSGKRVLSVRRIEPKPGSSEGATEETTVHDETLQKRYRVTDTTPRVVWRWRPQTSQELTKELEPYGLVSSNDRQKSVDQMLGRPDNQQGVISIAYDDQGRIRSVFVIEMTAADPNGRGRPVSHHAAWELVQNEHPHWPTYPILGVRRTNWNALTVIADNRTADDLRPLFEIPDSRFRVEVISESEAVDRWPDGAMPIPSADSEMDSVGDSAESLLEEAIAYLRGRIFSENSTGDSFTYVIQQIRVLLESDFTRKYKNHADASATGISIASRARGSQSTYFEVEIELDEQFADPVALLELVRETFYAHAGSDAELDAKIDEFRRRMARMSSGTGNDRSHRIPRRIKKRDTVGSSRVDLQACKLEYSIVSPK